MERKTANPAEIAQALALREAGYTALAISQRLGISVRSLQRHFSEHGTKKGNIKKEVLAAAKTDLIKHVTSDDTIKEEAARIIVDDLAHARHLRDVIYEASGLLKAESLSDAVLVMRAAAAYSTTIKNTSDMLRHSLRVDRCVEDTDRELPELVIKELSSDEVARLTSTREVENSVPGEEDCIVVED